MQGKNVSINVCYCVVLISEALVEKCNKQL